MAEYSGGSGYARHVQSLEIGERQVRQVEAYADKHGVANIDGVFEQKLNEYLKQPVNIGVTGQSGTGKSSLINTLRGLRPRDKNAAAVGTTETTMVKTPYPHPELARVVLWDLPGVNTPKYPQSSYAAQVKLNTFDALIICSASRFTESDKWLAETAHRHSIPFYFVRTKIDVDINNEVEDQDGNPNDEVLQKRVLTDVASHTATQLRRLQLPTDKVFIISTKLRCTTKWDFPRFSDELVDNSPRKNQTPLIMAMVACSSKFVEKKRDELEKRIPRVVREAGRNMEQHAAIVKEEIMTYMQWFGLSRDVLRKFEVDVRRLSGSLQQIEEKLRTLQDEPVIESTSGRNIGKWIFGIGYFFGLIHDNRINRKNREERQAKLRALEKSTSTRQATAIETAAEIALMEALDACAQLAHGVLQERKQYKLQCF